MQTVEDESGDRYLLVKRSADAWLVADPDTGEETYRDASELSVVAGTEPLATAGSGIPATVRHAVSAVPDEPALGLLVFVVDRGPVGVHELLDATTLCESDLHGRLAELVAADLLEETALAGERAYEASEAAREAVARLRG